MVLTGISVLYLKDSFLIYRAFKQVAREYCPLVIILNKLVNEILAFGVVSHRKR